MKGDKRKREDKKSKQQQHKKSSEKEDQHKHDNEDEEMVPIDESVDGSESGSDHGDMPESSDNENASDNGNVEDDNQNEEQNIGEFPSDSDNDQKEDSDSEIGTQKEEEEENEGVDLDESVEVRFVTALSEEYKVDPVPIRIPANVTRAKLSAIVNQLLGNEKKSEKPSKPRKGKGTYVPFDFVLGEHLIRTPLKLLLEKQGISKETVIDIRYFLAVTQPEEGPSFQHEDWISGVSSIGSNCVATVSYDGTVRLMDIDLEGKVINEKSQAIKVSQKPLRCLTATRLNENEDETILVTAGDEGALRAISVGKFAPKSTAGKSKSAHKPITGEGKEDFAHESAIYSIASRSDRICTGTSEGKVKFWSISEQDQKEKSKTGNIDKSKIRKTNPTAKKSWKITNEGELKNPHSYCCSSILFHGWENEICTGSWDRTAKLWDISTSICISLVSFPEIVKCLASLYSTSNCILVGCNDRCVRMWDVRAKTGDNLVSNKYIHSNPKNTRDGVPTLKSTPSVTAIAAHPTNQYLFATSTLDGSVRLWDSRSTIPLLCLRDRHDGGALAVNFAELENTDKKGETSERKVVLLSGGADKTLRSIVVPSR